MQNFVSFIKENYVYFLYCFEFVCACVGAFFAIVKSRRVSDLETEKKLLSNKYSFLQRNKNFLTMLPGLINEANSLYPVHGDGEKRFDFVYSWCRKILYLDDSQDLRNYLYVLINSILNCDKLEKISRDTQEFEPKKEFLYEKAENASKEGSEGLLQNVQKDESDQRRTDYVPRRN